MKGHSSQSKESNNNIRGSSSGSSSNSSSHSSSSRTALNKSNERKETKDERRRRRKAEKEEEFESIYALSNEEAEEFKDNILFMKTRENNRMFFVDISSEEDSDQETSSSSKMVPRNINNKNKKNNNTNALNGTLPLKYNTETDTYDLWPNPSINDSELEEIQRSNRCIKQSEVKQRNRMNGNNNNNNQNDNNNVYSNLDLLSSIKVPTNDRLLSLKELISMTNTQRSTLDLKGILDELDLITSQVVQIFELKDSISELQSSYNNTPQAKSGSVNSYKSRGDQQIPSSSSPTLSSSSPSLPKPKLQGEDMFDLTDDMLIDDLDTSSSSFNSKASSSSSSNKNKKSKRKANEKDEGVSVPSNPAAAQLLGSTARKKNYRTIRVDGSQNYMSENEDSEKESSTTTTTTTSTSKQSSTNEQPYISQEDRVSMLSTLQSLAEHQHIPQQLIQKGCIDIEKITFETSKTREEYVDKLASELDSYIRNFSTQFKNNQNNNNENINNNQQQLQKQQQTQSNNNQQQTSQNQNQQQNNPNNSSSHQNKPFGDVDKGLSSILSNLRTQVNTIKLSPSDADKFNMTLHLIPSPMIVAELKKDYESQMWNEYRQFNAGSHELQGKEKRLIGKYYGLTVKEGVIFDIFVTIAISFLINIDKDVVISYLKTLHKSKNIKMSSWDFTEIFGKGGKIKISELKKLKESLESTILNSDQVIARVYGGTTDSDDPRDSRSTPYIPDTGEEYKYAKQILSLKLIKWEDLDIAKGSISYKLRAVNEIDTTPLLLQDFQWISKSFQSEQCKALLGDEDASEFGSGCSCKGDCHSEENVHTCECLEDLRKNLNGRTYYGIQGKLLLPFSDDQGIYKWITECSRSRCHCSASCSNKINQSPRHYPLELFKTKHKGWGVRAKTEIPQHTYVSEYIGEIITSAEAHKRGLNYDKSKLSYLFDLDTPQLGNQFTIDATNYGNESRFINHSCEPNLQNFLLFTLANPRFPRIVLFSKHTIKVDEELTFDYQYDFDSNVHTSKRRSNKSDIPCRCKSKNCRKWLWRVNND